MPRARRPGLGAAATARDTTPWALLFGAALAAPAFVLGQGGEWQVAVLAALACLASPGAAIEAMLGLARLAAWVEGGDRRDPR